MQIKENAAFIPVNIAGQITDKACHINIKRMFNITHTSIFNKIHSSVL